MNPGSEEIWRKLQEDTGDRDKGDALRPLAEQMAQWITPVPSPQESESLLQTLLARLPAASPAAMSPHHPITSPMTEWWPWLLLKGQLRVVRGSLWLAAALLMVLGVLVTLLSGNPNEPTLWFVLFAPLIAAATMSFIYGPDTDPAQELIHATPVPPALLLLSRMLLVFSFDLLLALMGSAALAFTQPDVRFWPLIQSWLAPMTFLSAFAFCLTVFTLKAEAGILFSLALWFTQVLLEADMVRVWVWFWPDLLAPAAQPWLWVLALLLGGISLWWVGWSEGWLGRVNSR